MSDRAYIFAYVPGVETPALAGQVIVMATGNDGFCRFKYAREWLDSQFAFPLDPEVLPLDEGTFESQPGWEVFGAMRDAGPDFWGRKLIERGANRLGLGELDFLLAAGDERTGALAFSTDRAYVKDASTPPVNRLAEVAEAAARLDRDEPVPAEMLKLLGAGTGTLGGMRPKATVESDGALWIAKFPSREDRYAITRWEFGTLALAATCGFTVPEHRIQDVGGKAVLLVERFDRRRRGTSRDRAHYLSGLTMLGLHERDYGQGSYADLALWLRRYGSAPSEDVPELFRRMVFNVLVGNTDDHLRNHAAMNFGDGYRLSPVFDVMPWPTAGGERQQAIGVGHQGRLATSENALSDAALFGFKPEAAEDEIRRLQTKIAGAWEETYRGAGLTAQELEVVGRILGAAR